MKCDKCIYAEWNNRDAPTQIGGWRCLYKYQVPPLPKAYKWPAEEPKPIYGFIQMGEKSHRDCDYYVDKNRA